MTLEDVCQNNPDFSVKKQSKRFAIFYNDDSNKYGVYDKSTKTVKGNFNFVDVVELCTPKIILCQNEDGSYNVYGRGVQAHYKVDEYVVCDSHTIMLGNGGLYKIYDEDFKPLSMPIKLNKGTIDFIRKYFNCDVDQRKEYLRTHPISMEIAAVLYIFDKNNEAYNLYMSAITTNRSYSKKLNTYFDHLESSMAKYCGMIRPNVSYDDFKKVMFKLCKGLADDFTYIS